MHPNPRKIAPVIVLIIIAATAWWYFSRATAQEENGLISASGTIEAIQVNIASEIGGQVDEVLAQEGEAVTAGQVLVRFKDTLLQAQLAQAQAALAQAQANYNLVAAGMPDEQRLVAVTTAEMEVLTAQQTLDDLYNNAELLAARVLQEIALAENAIDNLGQRRDNLETPADQADIDAARAAVVLARNQLDRAQEDYAPYENKPENNLTRAALLSKLSAAQNYYDSVVTRLNNMIGSANELDLAQVDADLTVAQAQLADAKRRYELLQGGPDPDAVALAEARLASARAHLEAAQADPSPEQLAAAQSQVDAAQAALGVLQVQLEKLVLDAPTDGIVLERLVEPGEVVLPSRPLITMARLDHLTITVYVPEDRYGEIKLGQTAGLVVDSFPGETFTAMVIHIADEAEFTPRNVQTAEGRRSTVYAIKLAIDNPAGRLKPGMPGDVEFER
ncbi:MAG: hypothetical protein A2Z45_05215 [Chloroflexi bacterium RBG_19FT_COMBO_55_16]|nr:MAG: hypothetical protein A2Z45_05215 [Chloroflexi bacterium RBG_19FT_COMBO_55_16]